MKQIINIIYLVLLLSLLTRILFAISYVDFGDNIYHIENSIHIFQHNNNLLPFFFFIPPFMSFAWGATYFVAGILGINVLMAFISTISIYVFYLIFKELFSKNTALFAAFILSLNPTHIFIGTQAYLDVPMFLFWMLSIYSAIKNKWGFAGFWLSIACLTKANGLVILPVLAYLFIANKANRKQLGTFLFCCLPLCLFYLYKIIVFKNPLYPYLSILFNGKDIITYPMQINYFTMLFSNIQVWFELWNMNMGKYFIPSGEYFIMFISIFLVIASIAGYYYFLNYSFLNHKKQIIIKTFIIIILCFLIHNSLFGLGQGHSIVFARHNLLLLLPFMAGIGFLFENWHKTKKVILIAVLILFVAFCFKFIAANQSKYIDDDIMFLTSHLPQNSIVFVNDSIDAKFLNPKIYWYPINKKVADGWGFNHTRIGNNNPKFYLGNPNTQGMKEIYSTQEWALYEIVED